MTAASDELASRLRALLAETGLVEKRIIGGLGFMLNGNLALGTTGKGSLLVRTDPATEASALARGAELMHMGKRRMAGYVSIPSNILTDDAAIKEWIAYATKYVKTLPPK